MSTLIIGFKSSLEKADSEEETIALITWNLAKNVEDRSLYINSNSKVLKGVDSTLNYITEGGSTFDVEYGFPLKFFGGIEENQLHNHEFYEAVVSQNKDMWQLKCYDSLCVSMTISEYDRRFLNCFSDIKQILEKKCFPINLVNFRTMDGSNIFHYLV